VPWAERAVEQDGVVARAQLAAAGVSGTGVARMRRRGDLVALASGVYLVRGAPLTYRARLWAAVLATDGVLGFATAAHLWGMTADPVDEVHVVLPHDRRVYPPQWVRLHRVPVPATAIVRLAGLPVTSRNWSMLDYLPTLHSGERSRLADRGMQRGWISATELDQRLRLYPGRTGNRALRRLAAQLSDGAAAQSERVLHRLLRRAGLTGWVANYQVWERGELIGVIDVAVPARRLAIEIDGWAFHHDIERFQRDRARQNDLVMLGWTVLRFTWADLTQRPGYVRAMITRAAA
jgi:very-short-patch-repair endonuclease